jgi:hypothetical protein
MTDSSTTDITLKPYERITIRGYMRHENPVTDVEENSKTSHSIMVFSGDFDLGSGTHRCSSKYRVQV